MVPIQCRAPANDRASVSPFPFLYISLPLVCSPSAQQCTGLGFASALTAVSSKSLLPTLGVLPLCLESRRPQFKSCLRHFLVVHMKANHLTFLSFSFHSYKIGVMIITPIVQSHCEEQMRMYVIHFANLKALYANYHREVSCYSILW